MKAYPMETLKKAVLIVLLSVMAPTTASLRAAQAPTGTADKGRTPATAAEDKDQDAAPQKQDEEAERKREREEREHVAARDRGDECLFRIDRRGVGELSGHRVR